MHFYFEFYEIKYFSKFNYIVSHFNGLLNFFLSQKP